MRTTLDLDDRVVAIARARAAARGISLGKAVSELARSGYEAEAAAIDADEEFLVLPSVGHVLTGDMVEDALADGN